MASKFRIFTRRFFIYANSAVVFFFLLSCLSPYLNPQKWWFISFLGLAFPFLLVLVVLFLSGWLIIMRPRYALISGVALLFSIKSILVSFAFNNPGSFEYKRTPGTIRVLTWNVARFIELKKVNNKGSATRLKMLELLKQQDADVLCLQEFHTSTKADYYDNIKTITEELGYPYHYFNYDTDGDEMFYSSIIFSRYPIVDSGTVRYPRPALPDVLIHADIKFNSDTFRVFTTRLQSLRFNKEDYKNLNKIKTGQEDSLIPNSRTILSKLKRGLSYHGLQADLIAEIKDISPHPILFCADLNEIPNSYTYRQVKGDMQDAFLKKGFGIGRTFSGLSPTLRIDYIFADKPFRVRQFNRLVKNLSDHYMLVADVELRTPGP
jgi:endonuclease/exonuclease/phosphatase family metal-dependent hydrolase